MNKITVSTLASTLSTAALLSSNLAGAVEFAYQPRLEGGLMYYAFETEPASLITFDTNNNVTRSFSSSGFEFKDTMFFIGGGFTFFADRFFVDLSAQKAFSGDDTDNFRSFDFQPGTIFDRVGTSLSVDGDFDRVEWAISAGYSVTDSWAVYVGYKNAESEFEVDRTGIADLGLAGFETVAVPYRDEVEFDFEQDGPFLGTTYGWQIDQGALQGLFSANFAIAFLDGEVKNQKTKNAVFDFEAGPIELPDFEERPFKGDTVGLTFGVGWKGFTPVEGLTYTLGVNGYQYDFDSDDEGVSDVKETQINFRAGVAYTF